MRFFKKYIFQIQIILVNIPTWAYIFKIKRIPSSLNIFTSKNKRCYVYLPIQYNWPSLFRDHQTLTIMNHCCYCFDGPWKVEAEYIASCLNAFAKLQNARGASCCPVLIRSWPNCSHIPRYQSVPGSVREILWPRERCLLRRKLEWNIWRWTYSEI